MPKSIEQPAESDVSIGSRVPLWQHQNRSAAFAIACLRTCGPEIQRTDEVVFGIAAL